MTSSSIHFHCPQCRARIKAPLALTGKNRPCPRCQYSLVVPRILPEDAGPVLVMLEGKEQFTLGVMTQGRGTAVRTRERYPARHSA